MKYLPTSQLIHSHCKPRSYYCRILPPLSQEPMVLEKPARQPLKCLNEIFQMCADFFLIQGHVPGPGQVKDHNFILTIWRPRVCTRLLLVAGGNLHKICMTTRGGRCLHGLIILDTGQGQGQVRSGQIGYHKLAMQCTRMTHLSWSVLRFKFIGGIYFTFSRNMDQHFDKMGVKILRKWW